MRIFVTGASGWIGSAVIPELLGAGHEVVGLARSDASAELLEKAGAEVVRGTIDDLDILEKAARDSDGVIHLAFNHDIAFTGDFVGAASSDRKVVETIGKALAGTHHPFVIASGVLGVAPGKLATEEDGLERSEETRSLTSGPDTRRGTAHTTLDLADNGVRSSVVRLAPTVHGEGDNGFIATLVAIARQKGVSGYIGDGSSRWPAIQRLDAAHLFRLAVESAPAGSTLHAVAEEGVSTKDIAISIGRQLNIPVESINAEDAGEHFGFLAGFLGIDSPVSSERTRILMNWEPTHQGLLEDLDQGLYPKD